jgi:hypothetical protein
VSSVGRGGEEAAVARGGMRGGGIEWGLRWVMTWIPQRVGNGTKN